MPRNDPAPTEVTISVYGQPWMVDLTKLRVRMAELDAKRVSDALKGTDDSTRARIKTRGHMGWAKELGVNHMTLRRLLEGTKISPECFNLILAGLGFDWQEVTKLVPAA